MEGSQSLFIKSQGLIVKPPELLFNVCTEHYIALTYNEFVESDPTLAKTRKKILTPGHTSVFSSTAFDNTAIRVHNTTTTSYNAGHIIS